ncbi:MAG: TMEM165/GDT1 family protein, partial [Allobranchiibius sp.]
LPKRPVELVVAALFLVGAVLVWREGSHSEDEDEDESLESAAQVPDAGSFWQVAGLGYGVIFIAEWGDLTQILTANLAAKYDDPLSVGIGAVLGLWSVALLAILGGKSLLAVLPLRWITRIAAVVMTALGSYSLFTALSG